MKQTNLSKRVEKAKGLGYSHNPYEPKLWATWGSKDKEYGEKYYRVTLSHGKETISTPDGQKNITVFIADCQKDTGNCQPCNCPGNERHTVCYHSLGAIYRSFEQAKTKRLVSFFETYQAATQMSFGGTVAKIKSANGPGTVWCVVKDWPEGKKDIGFAGIQVTLSNQTIADETDRILSTQENINLMRDAENDEGID